MKYFSSAVIGISKFIDHVAGVILVGLMSLVVINVLLRAIWSTPIKGTYEYVGFFTAIVIGLSIAYCGAKNGHIAVTFLVERFHSKKTRKWLRFILDSISVFFLGFVTWQLSIYGARMAARGDVSPTTKIVYYPFVYITALGFIILALVILSQIIESFKKEEVN